MKMVTGVALLLAICLAGAREERRAGSDQAFAFRTVQEPLSTEDIRSALDVLGLKIERFACTVPAECKIRVSLQKYIHGAAEGSWGSGTYTLRPGSHRFILFTREQNNSLTFTFEVEGGRVSWGSMDVEGYHAKTSGRLDGGPLEKGRAVPFYLFAANLNGIESFPPDRPVEELTGKYALAVVLFVELL
jgi:hypothetical protein